MRALVFGEFPDPMPPQPDADAPRLVRHLACTPMELRDVPDPELRGPEWTVLRTRLTGICGSDVKQVLMDFDDGGDSPMTAFISFPQVLGHEVVATVEAAGPDAGVEPGQRVLLNPWLSCEVRGLRPVCPACEAGDLSLCWRFHEGDLAPGIHTGNSVDATGGFAELLPAHRGQLVPLPDDVDDEVAVLADPFSVALHAVTRTPPPPGGRAVVYGAGALGTCATAILGALHPDVAVATVARWPAQDALAVELGACTFAPEPRADLIEALAAWSGGVIRRPWEGLPIAWPGGIDVVYDTVGAPDTLEVGLRVLKARGSHVQMGLSSMARCEWTPWYFKEARLIGSNAFGVEVVEGRRQHAMVHYLDLVRSGRIDLSGMLTHTFGLDEWRDAFTTLIDQGDTGAIKCAFDLPRLIVDGGVRLDAAALSDAVARVAGGLAGAGVARGDVVAWQLPNRWEAVALYRACWHLGAVAAPVHHLAGAADVDAALGQVDPRLVVEADRLASLLAADPCAPAAASDDDLAVALFTSGSSGAPKAVLHSRGALADKAALMAQVHGLDAGDTVLMPAPLAHVSGLLNAVLVPGAAGMGVVLQQRWDPDEAARLVDAEGVTAMFGPPTFFLGLRQVATPPRSLRLVSCGGTGVTPDFVDSTAEALGCVVKRTYGSTEAPTATTSHAGDPVDKARSTDGRPTGPLELRIDPTTGELLVRGPEVFVRYTDAAQTAAAFTPDHFFRTGDLGTIDAEGWLTVTGRLKDVIIRGGENVTTAEVEAACEAHPAVRQAVAVGVPDERLGERVGVAVVLEPAAAAGAFDVDVCRAWFEARGLARFKAPEVVAVVESVPILAAGKPDRTALREQLVGALR